MLHLVCFVSAKTNRRSSGQAYTRGLTNQFARWKRTRTGPQGGRGGASDEEATAERRRTGAKLTTMLPAGLVDPTATRRVRLTKVSTVGHKGPGISWLKQRSGYPKKAGAARPAHSGESIKLRGLAPQGPRRHGRPPRL